MLFRNWRPFSLRDHVSGMLPACNPGCNLMSSFGGLIGDPPIFRNHRHVKVFRITFTELTPYYFFDTTKGDEIYKK